MSGKILIEHLAADEIQDEEIVKWSSFEANLDF